MNLLTLVMIFNMCTGFHAGSSDPETGFPLVYHQNFEDPGTMGDFVFSDPGPWFLTGGRDGGRALELAGKGSYEPEFRSPHSIGLICDYTFGDFVLEADLQQTGRDYGHRDICVFFSFIDSAEFYYVHLASMADLHAHNVFIVNRESHFKIADETTDGIRWIDGYWHHVRIERLAGDGTIRVYFDDMDTPIMLAEDHTFTRGFIGFGSFDDSGKIDNIRIWSPDAEKSKIRIFSKKE